MYSKTFNYPVTVRTRLGRLRTTFIYNRCLRILRHLGSGGSVCLNVLQIKIRIDTNCWGPHHLLDMWEILSIVFSQDIRLQTQGFGLSLFSLGHHKRPLSCKKSILTKFIFGSPAGGEWSARREVSSVLFQFENVSRFIWLSLVIRHCCKLLPRQAMLAKGLITRSNAYQMR